MVIASKQMTRVHNFNDKVINISFEDKHLDSVPQFKLVENYGIIHLLRLQNFPKN